MYNCVHVHAHVHVRVLVHVRGLYGPSLRQINKFFQGCRAGYLMDPVRSLLVVHVVSGRSAHRCMNTCAVPGTACVGSPVVGHCHLGCAGRVLASAGHRP